MCTLLLLEFSPKFFPCSTRTAERIKQPNPNIRKNNQNRINLIAPEAAYPSIVETASFLARTATECECLNGVRKWKENCFSTSSFGRGGFCLENLPTGGGKKKKDAKSFERAESGRKLKLNKPDEGEEAVKLVAGCSQSVSALESNQKISCRRKTKVD